VKLLLKLGGTLLDAADSRDGLARQVAGARSRGTRSPSSTVAASR